ncbi:MAG: hypothetical protein Q4G24_13285 [Paracoccus sp. (in: a-proteobacteria)]|uniref:hypothetical protein n=1 Tax=Paracoccus sp. TaxID=267 RepID=UPI0026DEFA9E|nr:hypothetical protein [Paracoccus sp. (in: a-proteobacteria)]MDO5622432.1 hypothetical protein [Paracoccus sp. (in: a-proteobacteria)]
MFDPDRIRVELAVIQANAARITGSRPSEVQVSDGEGGYSWVSTDTAAAKLWRQAASDAARLDAALIRFTASRTARDLLTERYGDG